MVKHYHSCSLQAEARAASLERELKDAKAQTSSLPAIQVGDTATQLKELELALNKTFAAKMSVWAAEQQRMRSAWAAREEVLVSEVDGLQAMIETLSEEIQNLYNSNNSHYLADGEVEEGGEGCDRR